MGLLSFMTQPQPAISHHNQPGDRHIFITMELHHREYVEMDSRDLSSTRTYTSNTISSATSELHCLAMALALVTAVALTLAIVLALVTAMALTLGITLAQVTALAITPAIVQVLTLAKWVYEN